ncbi:unnamed protein product [Prorocentrum cordatum]|uniref:Endonuclease/exonuclease/phosphatase domain-containing protein n=1 Tax=Prorocentrum cordatum TaxID=2364126 RepID=A0ABN9YGT4_9DINO|nr:unnamed protein product [Polarella glacialis]
MASHGRGGPEGAGVVLRGPKSPLWLCSCGCASNWASRLRRRERDRRCSTKVEDAARKAHKEAFKGRPKPGSHPQPRGAWARQKLAPWEHDKIQRQDSELAALRQQVEALKADSAKAKLAALSDLKEELQKLGGGVQATSCDKAVEAKYSEPPKPKSLPALEGQRRKLEAQHQKALAKVAELEDQRVKLDQRICEAKDSAAELKCMLQAADAEIESRHAAGVLGDGLRGLAEVLEQFKATAVENQAVLQGLIQLQDVVKKEQETLDAADDAVPGDGAGDGAADPGSGDPHEGVPGSAGSGGESVPVPDELVDSLMEDAPEGESFEQRRKHISDIIGAQLKRPRGYRDFLDWLDGQHSLADAGPTRRPVADITFVQETRVREVGREAVQRWHRTRGFDFDLAAGLSTGDGPQSASGGVGIGARQRFAAATLDTKFKQPHRVLRRVVNIGDGLAIDLMSVYLRDGEGMSEANADILWEVASQLRVAARPWILAGDFNMDPLQERLRHAEGYLLPLYDLHGDAAQKFAGRADGVRFVNVQLVDASRRRWAQLRSHETHAWGGLVSLLQRADLLVARGKDLQGLASLRARLAALRLADYDGTMAPVPRGELGAAATCSDAALRRRLIEHDRAQQQASQRSDAAAARWQWQAWAKGSATGGGKLAHRFSKPEPLAKATLVTADEDEGDTLPVNGDEAVRHCLKEWLPLWLDPRRRGGLEEAASWEAPEPLPSLEVDSLRYLLKRHGRRAGLGWDQLHPRQLLLLDGHLRHCTPHSVISGTVLSQTRFYKRGMASEWECLMCRGAPGTLWHRLYGCDGHAAFRKDDASPGLLRHAEVARAARGNCGEMFGRCLFPSLDHAILRRDPDGDPVRWYRRPASGFLTGLIFTDGSAVGTRWPELQRAGWSLAQCDRHGRLVAAAWGWVPLSMAPRQEARDGEDYAYHMAAFLCEGHVDFQTDCAGTVACAQRGAAWACRPGSPRAHTWNAFYASFDGSRSYTVTKVLAHATAADVEADRTTWRQRAGNRLADDAAKEGAKLALADDQLDLAYGLDLIARQAMLFTGKLHARMADRKLLDHASDVILEFTEPEAGHEEQETSGGHAAETSWGAAGAAAVALAAARASAEGDEPPAARRPRQPWSIGGHSIVERAVTGPGTDGTTMVHCVKCYAYAHQRTQGILGPRGTGAGREPQIDRIRRGFFPNVKGGRGSWRLGEQFFPSEAWRTKFSQRLSPAAAPEASRATGSGQQGPAQRLPRSRALLRFGVGPEQEADLLSWSARQRADRRSKGDPDELEGEASD